MKKSSGIYGVDAMDFFATKVDALAQCFDRLETSSLGNSSCMMYEVRAIWEICGVQQHATIEHYTTFQEVERVNAMQNVNPNP